jgi:hypothetical protein
MYTVYAAIRSLAFSKSQSFDPNKWYNLYIYIYSTYIYIQIVFAVAQLEWTLTWKSYLKEIDN